MNLILELSPELAERALRAGLLEGSRLVELLEMELSRQEAWQHFSASVEALRAAAQEEFGDLSEEELMRLVEEEIHALRAENRQRIKPSALRDEW